jgi:hypothetical protein
MWCVENPDQGSHDEAVILAACRRVRDLLQQLIDEELDEELLEGERE